MPPFIPAQARSILLGSTIRVAGAPPLPWSSQSRLSTGLALAQAATQLGAGTY